MRNNLMRIEFPNDIMASNFINHDTNY